MAQLGVATPSELAAYFSGITIAEARKWCAEASAQGIIVPVQVNAAASGPKAAFAIANWRTAADALPEPPPRMRLLSPFDPLVRDRNRLLRLFGFDYRFEAFVPEAKRKYGYYVLPMLWGGRIVGRLDGRIDRKASKLIISGLWWEPGIRVTRQTKAALNEALQRLATFVDAKNVDMTDAQRQQ
jgi:uncharacterized protein YcaQ